MLLIDECKELLDAYPAFFEANRQNYFSAMFIPCKSVESKQDIGTSFYFSIPKAMS